MKQERVVISTHNPTMRTALRLVALMAPLWAIYIPGLFLSVFGFFLVPVYFDPNERVGWLLMSCAVGFVSTILLLMNTLILSRDKIAFPPLKAASLPITQMRRVAWFWDPLEREAYARFSLESGQHIDVHSSRLSPTKIAKLKEAIKRWAPQCEVCIEADDLEDLIAFRERFYRPKRLSLLQTTSANSIGSTQTESKTIESEAREFNTIESKTTDTIASKTTEASASKTTDASASKTTDASATNTTDAIEIPYHPHEQIGKFFQSLGANEKYFWYCWLTVMLVPCILKLPDVVWGFMADFRHMERFVDVPPFVKAVDSFSSLAWDVGSTSLDSASGVYFNATSNPFGICILLGMAALALVALGMSILQPNCITLTRNGLEVFLQWQKLVLFRAVYPWKNMVEFQLDQFGDVVNPEKWRMQVKMSDGATVNLKIQAIKGEQARETLLKTITEMAPNAAQDPVLIRALMPPQRESYTELWLQSLATPPKRNRLAPLSSGQKLKSGRYAIDRQLAVGGQGVAYVASDLSTASNSFAEKTTKPPVVLKEFVLPVYTSRNVRQHALEKFENEARILEDLDHPQIVKLIDYFLEDHRAYLVLEHIDGMSLRNIIEENGPLSIAQILDLSMQMCRVLEYLHSLSPPVVHRDFTPDNLILNRDGTLVLIDFNVAQQNQWTTTGTVVGKHAYLPPEQFRGKPTTQSDLYAMGATLFFLCTGKDPEPITCSHPRSGNSSIAAQLDEIVAGLTAIELEDRYQTAADVRRDFESAIDTIFNTTAETTGTTGVIAGLDIVTNCTVETTADTTVHSINLKNADSIKAVAAKKR